MSEILVALDASGLEKTYASGTRALSGVSLRVPAGDFLALLGPNGAGKTTFIGIATGLVHASAGSLTLFGIDAFTRPELARRKVGVVPQNLNVNIFEKVIDIVVNQAGYYGIPRSIALPHAEEVLKSVGLLEKRNVTARELSGGMQRRLMIARALVHGPELLFLDEPTAGVDVESRRAMWDYLKVLTERGVTILLTTHYLEEAEQLARHVAVIAEGRIVAHGTLEEILALGDDSPRTGDGFRGGRLEEAYLKLTKQKSL